MGIVVGTVIEIFGMGVAVFAVSDHTIYFTLNSALPNLCLYQFSLQTLLGVTSSDLAIKKGAMNAKGQGYPQLHIFFVRNEG